MELGESREQEDLKEKRVNLENPDLTGHRVDQAPREPQDLQAIWDLWVSQLIPELRVTLVTLENQDHEDPPGVGDLQERKGRRASQGLPDPQDL